MLSFIHPSIHPCIHPSIHSFIRSYTLAFAIYYQDIWIILNIPCMIFWTIFSIHPFNVSFVIPTSLYLEAKSVLCIVCSSKEIVEAIFWDTGEPTIRIWFPVSHVRQQTQPTCTVRYQTDRRDYMTKKHDEFGSVLVHVGIGLICQTFSSLHFLRASHRMRNFKLQQKCDW